MKKLSSVWKRIATMMLAMCVVMGLYGLTNTFTVFAQLGADDNKYQAVYDAYDDELWGNILRPSEVYDKYGKMNGDYYVIIMEGCLMRLNGNEDVTVSDPTMIGSVLQQNGELPVSTRESLRKAVEKYDLDESMLPDDPSFPDGGTEAPEPTRAPSSFSEVVPDDGTDGSFSSVLEQNPNYDPNGPGPQETVKPTETTTPVDEPPYADVTPDAWYYEAVTAMSKGGLFKGYDDGLFHPDDNITYGQWATLMSRIAINNYNYEMQPGDHWAKEAFSKASRCGICEIPNETHGESLDSLYNRAQAIGCAYYLAHGDKLGLEDRLKANYTGKTWTFNDIPDGELVQQGCASIDNAASGDWYVLAIGKWSRNNVLGAYNLGITHGVDVNGTCNPTAPITRAEVAQLLYNMGVTREKMCDFRRGGIGS